LKKRTSINSIPKIHKEKEMADFRKWLYALAVVALLAGFTIPASAQTANATTVVCVVQSATDNLIRSQGYTEQVGDVVLACQGGTPTAAGIVVPSVNIQLFVSSVNITSQITHTNGVAGNFSEALLIVDEPNSATNPATQILNCGQTGTTELTGSGQSGPGVCSIVSDGVSGDTYNGTQTGGGHPNVFQGRQALGSLVNNSIVFQGVPFDPPGSITRFLRFTNVRVNANQLGIINPTAQVSVTMGITSSGNASLPLNILSLAVATIQNGLTVSTVGTAVFAQCIPSFDGLPTPGFGDGVTTSISQSLYSQYGVYPMVRFSEGFDTAWKPRNISETLANGTATTASGDGFLYSTSSPISNGSLSTDNAQNVPGVNYYSEGGFYFPSLASVPSPNPPNGFLTGVAVTGDTQTAFADSATGINTAGEATQGTRLALTLANLPNGINLYVPPVLFLFRQNTTYGSPDTNMNPANYATGVAVLTSTDAYGNTPFNPPAGLSAGGDQPLVEVSQTNGGALIVYEILFSDPFSNEYMDVPVIVQYAVQLNMAPPLGLPQPNVQATYTGGFAPFETALTAQTLSADPIPRFYYQNQGGNLFIIERCTCNLLWPFVTQQYGYDTGIAIANTSSDPFSGIWPGAAQPQAGSVTFNYYGCVGASCSPPPAAQTTSASTPIASGTVMVYTLSQGNTAIGLDNRGANFTGYLITTAQFEYCHGFAFISALNAGPTSAGISEGYLALVLDGNLLSPRANPLGESLGQ
jgi:hypothetical protein